MPTTTNSTITCVRGQSLSAVLNWTAGGTPVDVTGYTGRFQVRTTANAVLGTFDLVIVDGVFTLSLTPAQTRSISTGSHVWGVEFTSGGGQVTSTTPSNPFLSLPEAVR